MLKVVNNAYETSLDDCALQVLITCGRNAIVDSVAAANPNISEVLRSRVISAMSPVRD